MGSKRKTKGAFGGGGMKFRTTSVTTAVDPAGTGNGDGGGGGGGTRPLAEAATVSHVLGMMVVHLSRKIIYGVDISHKVSGRQSGGKEASFQPQPSIYRVTPVVKYLGSVDNYYQCSTVCPLLLGFNVG